MSTSDKEPTVVVYRRFPKKEGNDVIALFPYEPGTDDPGTMSSYQHIGQHGSASMHLVYETRPAKLEEPDVAALHRELESIGYRLVVRKRIGHDAFRARQKELRHA